MFERAVAFIVRQTKTYLHMGRIDDYHTQQAKQSANGAHIFWGVLENFNSRHDCVKDVYIRNLAPNLVLTHWGRVTHICVSKLTMIGSDNGMTPGRRQAIIWTNTGILLIGPLGTNVSEILIEIQTFSLKKIRLIVSSATGRLFSLGLNELNIWSFPVLMVSKWFVSDLKIMLHLSCARLDDDNKMTV